MREKKRFLTVMVLVYLCVSAAYAILICSKCGFENPKGSAVCTHCKERLPGAPPEEGDVSGKGVDSGLPDGEFKFLPGSVVEDEMRAGVAYLRNNEVELARIFFKNASALEMLTDPDVATDRPKQLLSLIERCRAGSKVKGQCPKCEGTGKAYMVSKALNGEIKRQTRPGRCSECKGRGEVLKQGTVRDRKRSLGVALSRNNDIQQARRYVSVGNAWVSQKIEDHLTIRQSVLLKKGYPSSCGSCVGIGLDDCSKCKGRGTVKCNNSGCTDGMVETVEGGRLGGSTLTKRKKCRVCGGDALMDCASCQGKGTILCRKCDGSGEKLICRRCGGKGLIVCRRCRGAGVRKGAVCRECQGDGVTECSSCKGEGRKR